MRIAVLARGRILWHVNCSLRSRGSEWAGHGAVPSPLRAKRRVARKQFFLPGESHPRTVCPARGWRFVLVFIFASVKAPAGRALDFGHPPESTAAALRIPRREWLSGYLPAETGVRRGIHD